MSYSTPVSPETYEKYYDRVILLREKLEIIGRGAQISMSYDIRVNASRLSLILSCRSIDFDTLAMMEEWASKNVPAHSVAS